MAIRVGDKVVKGVYTGDDDGNSLELSNIRVGANVAQRYTFTLNFVDAVSNGTFSTTQVTYIGYVGETFSGSRSASANSGYTLSSTTTSKSGANSGNVDITDSSGVTSAWEVTMPQGGGSATITSTGSAASVVNSVSVTISGTLNFASRSKSSITLDAGDSETFTVSASGNYGFLSSSDVNASESSPYITVSKSYNANTQVFTFEVEASNSITGSVNATITNTGSATADYNFDYLGSCTANTSGNVTCTTDTNGATATAANVSARTFNDGCETKDITGHAITVTAPSGYPNAGDTGVDTITVVQDSLPALTANNPTGSIAQNGTISFNESGYTSEDTVSSNSGCARTVEDVNWTYTVVSGSFCNNSTSGTVDLTQDKLDGSVTLTASSTSFTSSGASNQTVATIAVSGCDTGYSVTSTPNWATSCVISGSNLNCTVPSNSGAANGPSSVTVSRDGDSDSVSITQAAGVTCTYSGISVATGSSASSACTNSQFNSNTMNFDTKLFTTATQYYGSSTVCATVNTSLWVSDGIRARQWTGSGFSNSMLCIN